jgi:acyl-CoA synthetase (NDP forming)/GNAT superfamily N-acetyltransferase
VTVDDAEPAPTYPAHWEADVVLKDGATVHLRPIGPDDAASLRRFHAGQSEDSIYLRYFAPMPRLSARDVHHFTHVDHVDRVAFVCTLGDAIVGIARYDRIDDAGDGAGGGAGHDAGNGGAGRSAEIAFNVSDAHRGRGLGSVLLEHLAAAARENGIDRFVAEVLPRNRRMLTVFAEAGYEVSSRFDDGVVEVEFDLAPTDRSRAVMEAREHRAEAISMQRLFTPGSVAIIGAGRRSGTVGHRLLTDLVEGGFAGRVHVIHPEAEEVLGVRTVHRLDELTEPVDLAVVAVPADAVLPVVRECAAAGVRGLVVVSSGFAETGPEGLARQRELVRLARANGLRVVGPNSWGMINAAADVRLNVSLVPRLPAEGRLGLFSQSGGLAVAVLDAVSRRGLGVSTFLSAGNRADVSGNDCLQYWEEDPATDAVAMYMESFGNPRKFSRIARRLARVKPVIVLKSGGSSFGARTVSPATPPGHAVRRSAAPWAAFDSMLKQSGCIRVETLNQMLDVAQLVLHQPLPAGPRVGIVGNSDALGALIADACDGWGLEVAHGPVSLAPQATPEQFRVALEDAFSRAVDAVVATFIPPIATDAEEVARVLAEVSAAHPIPVVACFLGERRVSAQLPVPPGSGRTIPSYPTPEEAVRALAAVQRYAAWRRRDPGRRVDPPGIDRAAARALVADALVDGAMGDGALVDGAPAGGALGGGAAKDGGTRDEARTAGASVADGSEKETPGEGTARERTSGERAGEADHGTGVLLGPEATGALLAAFGIELWPQIPVEGPGDAAAAAARLGYPVALKATASHLRHRIDLGGVRLDIADEPELLDDLAQLRRRFASVDAGPLDPGRLVVQRMAPPGVACVVRSSEDPLFGPVVSFGLGGDATELLGDVAHRIPPLTDVDVADLVRSVRAAPKLFGHHGAAPVDVPALEDLLARVSCLADELPEVAELELNPVVVSVGGLAVLGARIRVTPRVGRADSARRELPGS